MRLKNRDFLAIAIVIATISASSSKAQQPIAPVDFRPFVDGRNWIVRQPLVYRIGVSNDSITVPPGFVTDLASIPPALQSIIQQNGPYLLPAVVHDYLYWKQTCTRDQADQIFLLAMIENKVKDRHRFAIHNAVRIAGGFAWDTNAEERVAKLIRIIPEDSLPVPLNMLWPKYRKQLEAEGVEDGPDNVVSADFCARGDMTTEDALNDP